MFFTVIETQIDKDGNIAYLTSGYTDINAAWSALYMVLASASIGSLPFHSAFLLDKDGNVIDGRAFDRRVA